MSLELKILNCNTKCELDHSKWYESHGNNIDDLCVTVQSIFDGVKLQIASKKASKIKLSQSEKIELSMNLSKLVQALGVGISQSPMKSYKAEKLSEEILVFSADKSEQVFCMDPDKMAVILRQKNQKFSIAEYKKCLEKAKEIHKDIVSEKKECGKEYFFPDLPGILFVVDDKGRVNIFKTMQQPFEFGGIKEFHLGMNLDTCKSVGVSWVNGMVKDRLAAIGKIEKDVQLSKMLSKQGMLIPHIKTAFKMKMGSKDNYIQVVKYCNQGTLFSICAGQGKKPAWNEMRSLFIDIAKGLRYLHRNGLVHNDIKPENILLHEGVGYLIDYDQVSHPGDKDVGGTPNYVSPERAQSLGPDFSDDIWSLGLMFSMSVYGVRNLPMVGEQSEGELLYNLMNLPDNWLQFPARANLTHPFNVLLKQMLDIDGAKRPSIDRVIEVLESNECQQDVEKFSLPPFQNLPNPKRIRKGSI